MTLEQQQLNAAISALQSQRGILGDAVVDAAIGALRTQFAALPAAADAPAEAVQALRQVTVLFLDMVGSTALSQHLDPEAVSDVMDGALRRCNAIVDAHRGKVLQYAGDSLLAAFGADEVREGDAERAVHCGLALLELGRALGSEVHKAHGHAGFNVRVGIHTGGVLLGGGVDADGTIRGIAVNIAARMEQTAPVGGLRISNDTHAQVRGLFDVQAQAPLQVKGVDAPVHSHLVLRARPRGFHLNTRGIEGVATRMVGRDAELAALQAAFHRLADERRFASLTVAADAGIGKSRLLHEFDAWSAAQPGAMTTFRGRAAPQNSTQPFGLLRDILVRHFQIQDDDALEVARGKMEEGIVPLFLHDDGPDLAEAHAHLLGHLIGIPWATSRHIRGILEDPRQMRNRAWHAAAQVFRRLAARDASLIMLQLEDLHWADGETLDFLSYLADVNREVPMLQLATTRPSLFEQRPQGIGLGINHQRIDLVPLDAGTSRALASELLQQLPEVPAALSQLLTGRAEGNPFYMEELVKMLIDQGALQTGQPWTVNAERLRVAQVPPTLTGVLQARLDGLPAPEKRALQQASVAGAVFWGQALAAIQAEAEQQLPALVQRQLTVLRAEALQDGLREYAFHHQLLHQVTYDTVLRRHKREGHFRVAQWLAERTRQGGLRAGDFLGLAAEHFERAGDAASAAEFHALAAEGASQRFAHERVVAHVGRALALLDESPEDLRPGQAALRWRLVRRRENTLGLQARLAEQSADLDVLAHLAEVLDDDQRRAEAAWRRGVFAMRRADHVAMESAARRGVACASLAGDDALRLQSSRLLAIVELDRGAIDAACELLQQGLADAGRLGFRGIEARLLNSLMLAAERRGDLVAALDLSQQSLQLLRESGDRVNEAIALMNLGAGRVSLGDLERARSELDGALHLLRANGDRLAEAAALIELSTVAVWQGDAQGALDLARQALGITVAAKAPDIEVLALLKLGDAELALGLLPAARQTCLRAQATAVDIGHPRQHDASARLALVALREGDAVAAMAALQPLLDAVAAGGTLDGGLHPRLVECACHQTLGRAGDPRAADWLQRAHTGLMTQADALTDPVLRQGFLHNIPHHREIVAAWASADHLGGRQRPQRV